MADDGKRRTILGVLQAWGMDLITDGVAFPLRENDNGMYVPAAILHGALSAEVVCWCVPAAGRLGTACLVETFDSYPPRSAFSRARTVIQRYRYPILFVYGVPSDPLQEGADETNASLQALLIHPAWGHTGRVHFVRSHNTAPMLVTLGELGN